MVTPTVKLWEMITSGQPTPTFTVKSMGSSKIKSIRGYTHYQKYGEQKHQVNPQLHSLSEI